MGSHAGKVSGPINDPDWGAVSIVLQGDYHHDDDIFFSSKTTDVQLKTLGKLVSYLKSKYYINQLLMHREVVSFGTPTVCSGDSLVPLIDALKEI